MTGKNLFEKRIIFTSSITHYRDGQCIQDGCYYLTSLNHMNEN